MRKKTLLTMMFVIAAVLGYTSCSNDDDYNGVVIGNPMPGTWYANNINFQGRTVDMVVKIGDNFEHGDSLYSMGGDSVGCMNTLVKGNLYRVARIRSCYYNNSTYTGRFIMQYLDKDSTEKRTYTFYYDPKYDRFTVIELNYNITFTR